MQGGAITLRLGVLIAVVMAFFVILGKKPAPATASRPNFLVVQVDDLSMDVFRSKLRAANGRQEPTMRKTRELLGQQGTTFSRFYANNPICAPSRASLLSGLTTHNHGMLINAAPFGYETWRNSPQNSDNLATWLDDIGYWTVHVGKYMNGFGPESSVPPGWDTWITSANNSGAPYYGYSLNINGRITNPIGSWAKRDKASCSPQIPTSSRACKHANDVHTAYAVREIRRASQTLSPFFLALDLNAPHDDGRLGAGPEPPARYRQLASRAVVPASIDDAAGNNTKPYFIKELKPLTSKLRTEARNRFRTEVASMRAVDDTLGRLVEVLRKTKQLSRTYVVFISDNGMFHGQHRIAYGKFLPHEPSTRQPLVIRGPKIRQGSVINAPASTIDLAPTIMSLASGNPGAQVDGKSLVPYLRNPSKKSPFAVPLEGFNGKGIDDPGPFTDGMGRNRPNQALVLNYTGFVSGRWKFIHYFYGENELYDLKSDPREKVNLAADPDYQDVIEWAQNVAEQLKNCSGTGCQVSPGLPRG